MTASQGGHEAMPGKTIEFVDQTIRDAQQSLWGFLMSTDMIAPIASTMDEVGYKAVGTVGGNGFVVQSRYYGEDPWDRIRLVSKAMPRTPLRGSYMTTALASFDVDTPLDVIALWIRRSVANGMRSFWVCDYQADMDLFVHFAKIAKEEGAEVIASLMYSVSPAHDEAHWTAKTRLTAEAKDYIDAILIEDASGLLTPERTRSFLTIVQQHCDGIPLEFHAHCNSGLAPLCYLEAIQMGVRTLHTAVAPLANATSLPSTESILRNARRLGYSADLDEQALEAVSTHFRSIAHDRGFAVGTPEEYDLFHYEHQVPGGMMTNLKRQLKELGMEDRLDEVLQEVLLVRAELGYPVMATPFSQIVGVQAVENVVSGERYERVPDTVVKYVMGFYGETPAPIAQDILDLILSRPTAQKLKDWQPQGRYRPLEELRREVGPDLSDDELLLRILIPGRGAGGAKSKSRASAVAPQSPPTPPAATNEGFPMAFTVEVDGEVFDVKIGPSIEPRADGGAELRVQQQVRELPAGAVVCGTDGLVVSVKAHVGDVVSVGDVVATFEAMKMIRQVAAPHSGKVQEICVSEGDMVGARDLLMVVV